MDKQEDLISENIEEYLLQNEHKELVRFITCGNVDDGKSTLIGRLLFDSKMIFEDQLAAITHESKRLGNVDGNVDLSLLVDGLQSEREQGITIDVAYRFFSTSKRKFIIADTPGHEQYTRNMVTGASTADLAVILIDARYGVQTQTKRHSFIAHLLGIKHFIIAINKMDLIDYDQGRYENIKADYQYFAQKIEIKDIHCVPISALKGDNIIQNSLHMPWYEETSIFSCLETVNIAHDTNLKDFRFPVQYVNRPNLHFRGFSGTVASGEIAVGDEVLVLPDKKHSVIKSIVTYDGKLQSASATSAVTLVLSDEIDVSRGDVIVKKDLPIPHIAYILDACVVWMNEESLQKGKKYYIKQGTTFTQAYVSDIYFRKDVNTLVEHNTKVLRINEIGNLCMHFSQKLVFDTYVDNRQTGRFIFIDRTTNNTVGIGMILRVSKIKDTNTTSVKKVGIIEKLLRQFVTKRYPHWNIHEE